MKSRLSRFLLFVFIMIFALCLTACEDVGKENDKDSDKTEGEVALSQELIGTLTAYLKGYNVEYDMPAPTLEEIFDGIKDGDNALKIGFDDSDVYYACAYCVEPHESETKDFCCVDKYEWIGFDGEENIREVIDGKKSVAIFRIDKSSCCTDILSGEEYSAEHYRLCKLTFENGKYAGDPPVFSDSFIYVTSESGAIYLSTDEFDFDIRTLRFTEREGKDFLLVATNIESADGTAKTVDLKGYFGKYYQDLIAVMKTGEYVEQFEGGGKTEYGLIALSDIADIVSAG